MGDKKLAVFDLDETLVHCEVKDYTNCDKIIEVKLPNLQIANIGINIRPYLTESLKEIKEKLY